MITTPLIRDIHRILKPGGELFFQSDVWSVALDALEIMERSEPLFINRAGPWTFWKEGNPFGARSWRETHCESVGRQIWRGMYDKVETSPAVENPVSLTEK